MLDDLFVIKPGHNKTGYNSLKRLPKNPTISHFKELLLNAGVNSIPTAGLFSIANKAGDQSKNLLL